MIPCNYQCLFATNPKACTIDFFHKTEFSTKLNLFEFQDAWSASVDGDYSHVSLEEEN